MRICVISYSGNVGKSTIATQLLKPRLADARLLHVETLNTHPNANRSSFSPDRYAEILIAIEKAPVAVVDVGASCAKLFIDQATTYASLTTDFDLFIVPATPDTKVLADTAATVHHLNRNGVRGDRIVCLPSRVVSQQDLQFDFAPLLSIISAKTIDCRFESNYPFLEREVFERLQAAEQSLDAVLKDSTDWGAKLRATTDKSEQATFAATLITARLARGAKQSLDDVFAAVLAKPIAKAAT